MNTRGVFHSRVLFQAIDELAATCSWLSTRLPSLSENSPFSRFICFDPVGMGCPAYHLCRGSGPVPLKDCDRASRRRALFEGPFATLEWTKLRSRARVRRRTVELRHRSMRAAHPGSRAHSFPWLFRSGTQRLVWRDVRGPRSRSRYRGFTARKSSTNCLMWSSTI